MSIRGPSSGLGGLDARRRSEEADRREFVQARTGKPAEVKENFITQVIAARQPPRLVDDSAATSEVDGAMALFGTQVTNLANESIEDITGDLAEIYLTYSEAASSTGQPALSDAFDYLGEVMLQYEHIRLMRTGDLG